MNIKKEHTIADVQAQFSEQYPLLRLAMYAKEHAQNEGSKKKDELSSDMLLSDISPSMIDGDIKVYDDLTVEALEGIFEDQYGLHVQVFRKSGDIWLQTSKTDHWTLRQHMEHAS